MGRDHTRFRPATRRPEIATFHVSERDSVRDQAGRLCAEPYPSVPIGVGRAAASANKSLRRNRPQYRVLVIAVSLPHSRHHSAALADQMACADQVPAHDGALRVFYGAFHVGVYFVFDRIAAVGDAAHLPPLVTVAHATWAASLEVVERPFFAIGFVAFALLVPLAATSTVGMIRLMGGHRWRVLHQLVYPAAIASVLHTYWPLSLQALPYEVILAILLALRVARGIATR